MYGVYDAYVVYGWKEGNRNNQIQCEWQEDHGIDSFARDVVRNHAGELIYGLQCTLDKATGLVTIDSEARNLVRAAHRASGSRSALGYHTAMRGDYDSQHRSYVPDKRNGGGSTGLDDGSSSPPAKKRNKTDSDSP